MKSIGRLIVGLTVGILLLSLISYGFTEHMPLMAQSDDGEPLPQAQPARIVPKPEQPPEPVFKELVPLEQVVRDAGGNLYSPSLDWVVQQVGQCRYNDHYVELADISNHWAKSSIESLVKKGVLSGYSDHTFKPDDHISRAEFVVLLIRSLCVPGLSADVVFTDVSEGAWYYGPVNAAYKLELVGGVGHGKFEPGTHISRQEVAVILSRLLEKIALIEPMDEHTQATVLGRHSDGREVAGWARTGVAAMLHYSFMQGTSATAISPKLASTRAEAAALIDRIITLIHKEAK